MADDKDYYDILGVGRTATDDEIRTAFRKLARRYHPDVSQEADGRTTFRRGSGSLRGPLGY